MQLCLDWVDSETSTRYKSESFRIVRVMQSYTLVRISYGTIWNLPVYVSCFNLFPFSSVHCFVQCMLILRNDAIPGIPCEAHYEYSLMSDLNHFCFENKAMRYSEYTQIDKKHKDKHNNQPTNIENTVKKERLRCIFQK